MRLHAMPAPKKGYSPPALGVECTRADVDTSGTLEDGTKFSLRAEDQKKVVLRAYYVGGLTALLPEQPTLSSSLAAGRFSDAATHAAATAAAAVAVPAAIEIAKNRTIPAIPADASVNMKLLTDHLHRVMPGLWMLYLATKVISLVSHHPAHLCDPSLAGTDSQPNHPRRHPRPALHPLRGLRCGRLFVLPLCLPAPMDGRTEGYRHRHVHAATGVPTKPRI